MLLHCSQAIRRVEELFPQLASMDTDRFACEGCPFRRHRHPRLAVAGDDGGRGRRAGVRSIPMAGSRECHVIAVDGFRMHVWFLEPVHS